MPHAYTEDQLVEQPAIGLFAELGWTTVSALEEIFCSAEPSLHPSPSGRGSEGEGRAALLRETKGEVVLESRLRAAMGQLNAGRMGSHALPPAAITAAVDELIRDVLRQRLPNVRAGRFLGSATAQLRSPLAQAAAQGIRERKGRRVVQPRN